MHHNDSHVLIDIDDEHPFFTTVWEQSKAARGSTEPLAVAAEIRIGDTMQKFYLENVSDLKWRDARAYMQTRWRPLGDPTPITPTIKGDTPA